MAEIDVTPQFKRKLLDVLKTYKLIRPDGSIVVIPKIKAWRQPVFEGRVHLKGVMGPLPLTEQTVERIGGDARDLSAARAGISMMNDLSKIAPGEFVVGSALEVKEKKELPVLELAEKGSKSSEEK